MSKVAELSTEDFDAYLEAVIESLPEDVQGLLDEVPVIVEDEPPAWLLKDMKIEAPKGASDLCGVHWGTPLSERTVIASFEAPQIRIFRGPIRRLAGDRLGALKKQIRITLLHEIGHHFGLSEDRLDEMGYG